MATTFAASILRLARRKARLSQRELARRAGTSQPAIAAYESGRRDPTLGTLQRLLRAADLELRVRIEPVDRLSETLDEVLERHFGAEEVRQGEERLRAQLARRREELGV